MRSQVASPLVSGGGGAGHHRGLADEFSAWVDCAVCCSETSVASESLVLSCCWTPANSTNCWVN